MVDSLMPTPTMALIACQVMQPELDHLTSGRADLQIHYLQQSLHRTPSKMASEIQAIIDAITGSVDKIILGYGLCSNGIVGVTARQEQLIVPLCHDCISFFLGSAEAYRQDFSSRPGTYYLTPGWIQEKKDPLHIMRDEYFPRYGEETAIWAMREELKHYTHIVLIDNGLADIAPLRVIAQENADYFGLEYAEIKGGSLDFFRRLIDGPYSEENFLLLKPGERIEQEFFIR